MRLIVALAGSLLLIVTVLLVGPAFAVSAAMQRRTLALVACNGANTAQLRHTALAQGVVLGALAAIVAALSGVVIAWAVAQSAQLSEFLNLRGPFEVPWGAVIDITVTAVVSALVTALLPSLRLGRLDIVAVMRGQNVSPPASRFVLAVGLVATVGGGAWLLQLAREGARAMGGTEIQLGIATTGLILGALMLAPMPLVGASRLGSALPVSLRMATRDAGRQRSRSVPAVGAILAGISVLAMTSISAGSDAEQARLEYTPKTVLGEGIVNLEPRAVTTAVKQLGSAHHDLVAVPFGAVEYEQPLLDGEVKEPYEQSFLNVVPAGCTIEQTPIAFSDSTVERCDVAGTWTSGSSHQVLVLDPEEIIRRLDLSGPRAETIRAGGVVASVTPGRSAGLTDGKVRLGYGTILIDPNSMRPTTAAKWKTKAIDVPAVEFPRTMDTVGALASSSLLIPTATAKAHGWPVVQRGLLVHNQRGDITPQESARLDELLGGADNVQIERGWQNETAKFMAAVIVILVALLMVVTMTTTALTMTQQRPDQATLAAVGASRRTRRRMAAAQAYVITVIGTALGIAVGVVPGLALAYPLTAGTSDPVTGAEIAGGPIVVIPWLTFAGLIIVVPLLAAALAAGGIRKAPDATQRTG